MRKRGEERRGEERGREENTEEERGREEETGDRREGGDYDLEKRGECRVRRVKKS